jgi:SAM-dependent methyltransferase
MASHFRPFTGRKMLEVGAGTGNLTAHFLDCKRILAVDLSAGYLRELKARLGSRPGVATEVMDVTATPDPLGARRFESILCLNVLEHLQDDDAMLRRFHDHLEPGGRLMLLVPAHRALYGAVDEVVGHHRRYSRPELKEKLEEAGFLVTRLRYFNMLGALGWWFNVRVLRRKYLPGGQSRLLNLLVPLLRLEDRFSPPFGLSLIAVAMRMRARPA